MEELLEFRTKKLISKAFRPLFVRLPPWELPKMNFVSLWLVFSKKVHLVFI